jgi:hypothetical protein
MSEEEFLARWSRRKQQAKAGPAAPRSEAATKPEASARSPDAHEGTEHEDPDLSSLPPIDAIDASTDITAFLRKGIPQELSRAALRRAWSADPAIRDFVGLAENAWDFNDPNAMPGFGPLDHSPEQVEALVRRIVGGRQLSGSPADVPTEAAEQTQGSPPAEIELPSPAVTSPARTEAVFSEPPSDSVASQPMDAAPPTMDAAPPEQEESPVLRRTHGGALPAQE